MKLRAAALAAVVLAGLLSLAPAPAAAALLLEDGFESGATGDWSTATGGDGAVVVQSEHVRSGSYAARLSASSASTSYAMLRRSLVPSQTSLDAQVGVNVLAEGLAGGNVPLLRLFDGSTRLLSVIRQNQTGGDVYVMTGSATAKATAQLPLGTWMTIGLRVFVDGASSTVRLSMDGTTVYETTSTSLGGTLTTLQLGNEVRGQAFDIVVDDVQISNDVVDDTAPDTVIDSGPSGTVDSAAASFTFSSSTDVDALFSCRLDAGDWATCTSPASFSRLSNGEHTFVVRAVDTAGNVDPTPATRTWTVASTGPGCDPLQPPPTTADPGEVVIADGFEDPALPLWTKVVRQGDAQLMVQDQTVRSGGCAVQLHVTTETWDSRANLQKTLPQGTDEVWLDGWFLLQEQGVDTAWNVPTFRILANGKRVFDVSRQNGNGNVFVRYPKPGGGWTYLMTGRKMDLGRWYRIKAHVVANGSASTVEVWIDGTRYVTTTSATLGVDVLDVVMVGAEHQGQEGVFAADDVVAKALVPPPTDVVLDDGFESGTLAGWTSTTTSGASASVQSTTVRSGAWAAQLTSPTSSSTAGIRRPLTTTYADLTAGADVQVATEGSKNGTVPLLTLADPGGAALVALHRLNGSGALLVRHSGATISTAGVLPLGSWARVSVRAVASGAGAGSVEVLLDGVLVHRTTTASIGSDGTRSILVGGSGAFTLLGDDVVASTGAGGPPPPQHELLIADHLNKRLLITDFHGRILWKMDNPVGQTGYSGGPIGVRWLPGNQILATFGTGEVGVIDVATKKFVWMTKGYGGDWFQSPYDAELLPDGRLAVALRANNGGRISVYDRTTGEEVWRHLLSNAHSVSYRTAEQSWNSDDPTLLVGGWGSIREISYRGTAAQAVTWQVKSEYTHDVLVVDGGTHLLSTEGYYIQKIDRNGSKVWKRSTPDENRRMAVNPAGGFVYTVAESDRIEFRDANGFLVRDWSRLSDGTVLDYPYGLAVIDYTG